jgi:hypothetical protein
MADHSHIRASDADRAQIAQRLRRATDEGRLLAHEFDERLGQALNARTYGELDEIVADLPAERESVDRPARAVFRRRRLLIPTAAVATAAVVASLASLDATGVSSSGPTVAPPPFVVIGTRIAQHAPPPFVRPVLAPHAGGPPPYPRTLASP